MYQAASREAMEEAGVKGIINVRYQCLPFTHSLTALFSSMLSYTPATRFTNDDADPSADMIYDSVPPLLFRERAWLKMPVEFFAKKKDACCE